MSRDETAQGGFKTESGLKIRNTTLCYIEREGMQGGEYLMLLRNKKENDENAGKWIGVGGKFEAGESPEDCVLREVREETGLKLTKFRLRGLVTFVLEGWGTDYMHLYTASEYEGNLRETCEEGELRWIPKAEIPELSLWEGDRIFLKLLTQDAPFFSLKLRYDREDRLVEHVLVSYPEAQG